MWKIAAYVWTAVWFIANWWWVWLIMGIVGGGLKWLLKDFTVV